MILWADAQTWYIKTSSFNQLYFGCFSNTGKATSQNSIEVKGFINLTFFTATRIYLNESIYIIFKILMSVLGWNNKGIRHRCQLSRNIDVHFYWTSTHSTLFRCTHSSIALVIFLFCIIIILWVHWLTLEWSSNQTNCTL